MSAPTRHEILLRDAGPSDLPAIQAIYAGHVLTGTASFEEEAPTVADMGERLAAVQGAGLPWLVAAAEGSIAGYAYASRFHSRSAYRFTVEDSIYLAPEFQRRGIGRALLAELIVRCTALGLHQMMARIGDSANLASIRLHEAAGFTPAGTLEQVGFKFGRWLDVVHMQRRLNS